MKLGLEELKNFGKCFLSHFGFAFAGWIAGWFHVGLASIIIAGGLYSGHITFQKIRRRKAALSQNFFKNEKEAIQNIFDDVPRWVSEMRIRVADSQSFGTSSNQSLGTFTIEILVYQSA